jgi:hypothetical protein
MKEQTMFKTPEKIKQDFSHKKAFLSGIKTVMDKTEPKTNEKGNLVINFNFRLDHNSFPDYIPTLEKQLSDAGWMVEVKEGHNELFPPSFNVNLISKTVTGLD